MLLFDISLNIYMKFPFFVKSSYSLLKIKKIEGKDVISKRVGITFDDVAGIFILFHKSWSISQLFVTDMSKFKTRNNLVILFI